jgi:hypothetical protein
MGARVRLRQLPRVRTGSQSSCASLHVALRCPCFPRSPLAPGPPQRRLRVLAVRHRCAEHWLWRRHAHATWAARGSGCGRRAAWPRRAPSCQLLMSHGYWTPCCARHRSMCRPAASVSFSSSETAARMASSLSQARQRVHGRPRAVLARACTPGIGWAGPWLPPPAQTARVLCMGPARHPGSPLPREGRPPPARTAGLPHP